MKSDVVLFPLTSEIGLVLDDRLPNQEWKLISYCTSLLLTYVVLIDMVSAMIPNVPKNIHVSLMQIIITYQLAQWSLV